MDDPNSVRVGMVCDCGHEYQVPIAGQDLESVEFACPACGDGGRFDADQITDIVRRHQALAELARQAIENGPKGDQ